MDLEAALTGERRARLAAERLLAQKEEELGRANRELARHAHRLSAELMDRRAEMDGVRSNLAMAESKVVIAERRLWASIGALHDGFALFDVTGRLVAANPAWLHPFDGMAAVAPGASYAEIVDIALSEGLIDIGREAPAEFRARLLARWDTPRQEPLTLRLWSGTVLRIVESREAGGDRALLAIDMTRLARRMGRLQEARSRAEAASRAKSRFLANMSHELRTPLNGVVALSEVLAETPLEEGQRSTLDTIRSSGEALLAIIDDLLDLSKADAGHMALHPAPFDPEALVQEVARLIAPSLAGRPVALVVDYDMFLPSRLIGDAGRLRQILTNLAGNAAKFTERGEVRIRVTGHGDGGRWSVHFTVEDSGIGIAPELQRYIFGEFNQVEDGSSRRFQGTGLGLAITERLVRLMGGEIWVESQPGAGACFGFRLTLDEAEKSRAPEPRMRNVLLVDPDPGRRGLRAAKLSGLGFNVQQAGDGVSALAGLSEALGLVLTVPELPDLSLGELVAALSQGAAPVPVLTLGTAQEGLALPALRELTRADLREAIDRLGAVPAAAGAAGPARLMRVLAAEDNATNRLVLRKMLEPLAIELRFAEDGVEALALWQEWRPDLIFMDISMPRMDGKEATRRIRAAERAAAAAIGATRLAGHGTAIGATVEAPAGEPLDGADATTAAAATAGSAAPHVRIVALTAHALPGDAAGILEAGLDHYLAKPLRRATLLEQVAAAHPPTCAPIQPPALPSPEPLPAVAE